MELQQQIERIYYDMRGRVAPYMRTKLFTAGTTSGIIKPSKMYRKKTQDNIEAMPKKQLQRIIKGYKRQGGVIQMNEATDAYLENKKAEAITYNSNTILLKQKPGRAAVFEELIHATQYRLDRNDGSERSRLVCEIEAQEKLIRCQKSYGLTTQEVHQTERALKQYKADLKKYDEERG